MHTFFASFFFVTITGKTYRMKVTDFGLAGPRRQMKNRGRAFVVLPSSPGYDVTSWRGGRGRVSAKARE